MFYKITIKHIQILIEGKIKYNLFVKIVYMFFVSIISKCSKSKYLRKKIYVNYI